jgi:hypothetical protein
VRANPEYVFVWAVPYEAMPSGTRPRSEAVASPSSPTAPAEHIFISYAWENRVVADWLTLRLTAAGYRVWCDRFKMLGGERFPAQIDHAIKHQTFRMLGLLSRHSLHKPNPVNERTLALAIARERNIDFYIPLDLEGLTATDLNWMISSIRDRQRYALHPSTPLGGARSRAGPGDRANVAHRMRP